MLISREGLIEVFELLLFLKYGNKEDGFNEVQELKKVKDEDELFRIVKAEVDNSQMARFKLTKEIIKCK